MNSGKLDWVFAFYTWRTQQEIVRVGHVQNKAVEIIVFVYSTSTLLSALMAKSSVVSLCFQVHILLGVISVYGTSFSPWDIHLHQGGFVFTQPLTVFIIFPWNNSRILLRILLEILSLGLTLTYSWLGCLQEISEKCPEQQIRTLAFSYRAPLENVLTSVLVWKQL